MDTRTVVIRPVNRPFEAGYLFPYVGRNGIARVTGQVRNEVPPADTRPYLAGNRTHTLTGCKTPNLTGNGTGCGSFFCLDNATAAKRWWRRWRQSIRYLVDSPEVLRVLCHRRNIESIFLASLILRRIRSRISYGIPVRTKIHIVISRGQSRHPVQRRAVRYIHFCIIRSRIFRAPTIYEGKNSIRIQWIVIDANIINDSVKMMIIPPAYLERLYVGRVQ